MEGKMSLKKPAGKIVLAAVIAFIAAAACLIIFMTVRSGGTSKEDSMLQNNAANGGDVTYDSETVYFFGKTSSSDSDNYLYVMDKDGKNIRRLSDRTDFNSIRKCGDGILYSTMDDEYILGYMKTDGSEDRTVIKKSDYITDEVLYNGQIYYLYDSEYRVCSMDGTSDTKLLDNADKACLQDGTVYYSSDDKICSFSLKEKKTVQICTMPNGSLRTMIYKDGYLIFSDSDSIYKVAAKEGAEPQKIISKVSAEEGVNLSNFLVSGNDVYFTQTYSADEQENLISQGNYDSSDADDQWEQFLIKYACKLYKTDMNGTNPQEIKTDHLIEDIYGAPGGKVYVLDISNCLDEA
jgi:hypothetical protein